METIKPVDAAKLSNIASRAQEVTHEITELVRRHYERIQRVESLCAAEEADVQRLFQLLDEVRRYELWRYVVNPATGKPCESVEEYQGVIGLSRMMIVRVVSRPYQWMYRVLSDAKKSVPELEQVKPTKAMALARLFRFVPNAVEHKKEWIEYAQKARAEEVFNMVSMAIREKRPDLQKPLRVERFRFEEDQWEFIQNAYEVYSRTTDYPSWGKFFELAAASLLNDLISADRQEVDAGSVVQLIGRLARLLAESRDEKTRVIGERVWAAINLERD